MIALSLLICFSIVYSQHVKESMLDPAFYHPRELFLSDLSDLEPIIQYSPVLEHFVSDNPSETKVPIPAIYADSLPLVINLCSLVVTDSGNVICLDSIQVKECLSEMAPEELIGLLRTLHYLGFDLPKNGSLQPTLLSLTVDALIKLLPDANVVQKLRDSDHGILFEIFNRPGAATAAFMRFGWKSCSAIVPYLHWITISDCIDTLCWKIRNTNRMAAPDMLNFFITLEEELLLSDARTLATLIHRIVSDIIKQPSESPDLLKDLLRLVRRDAFNVSTYPLICRLIDSLHLLPRIDDYSIYMTVIELFELMVSATDVDVISQPGVPFLIKGIGKASPTSFLYGPAGIQAIDILVKRIANEPDDKTPNRLGAVLANLALLFRSNICFWCGHWWITERLFLMIHGWVNLVGSIVDLMPKYDAFVYWTLKQLFNITQMTELSQVLVKYEKLSLNKVAAIQETVPVSSLP